MKLLFLLAAVIACSYGQKVEFTDPCAEVDVNYQGGDLKLVQNIKDWRACAATCKQVPVCKVFTFVKKTGCCYLKDSSATANKKQGVGSVSGPQGCGLYPSKDEIICENKSGSVKCGKGLTIKVIRANYGRVSSSVCPLGGKQYTSNTKCESTTTLAKVQASCNGKQTCDLDANNKVFGDPCFGTTKYLSVSFQCQPAPVTVQSVSGYTPKPYQGGFCYFEKKFKPLRNNLIGTMNGYGPIYEYSFEFYPNAAGNGWQNIMHVSSGSNIAKYGDRNPGVWIYSTNGKDIKYLHICAPINGVANKCYNIEGKIPLNKWHTLLINQKKVGNNIVFSIYFNGKLAKSYTNTRAQMFNGAKMYVSDPWYNPGNVWIRNLCVGTL